jgi:hypothetical protein
MQECCSRCKANGKCEVFELGHGGCISGSANCTHDTINCFLIGGFNGKLRANKDRVTGCVRGGAAPSPGPPPPPDSMELEKNNTVAAFLLARGPSAMLELPVAGAYESMSTYDVDSPLLKLDFGAALGPAKQLTPGTYSREFERATVSLDCHAWTSTFEPKGKGHGL